MSGAAIEAGGARQRIVEANGFRMRVTEQGEGPVVLLCHGFPETAGSWRNQLPALAAAGYRAVAPDLRGFGGTDGPADAGQYTILHLVGDMVALLDALQVSRAVVVGNDWGATLAWPSAPLQPDRFRAVAALGVPMMGQPPRPPTELFPRTDDALFYTLYFQEPGVAEAELERDVRTALLKILHAASGDAGPAPAWGRHAQPVRHGQPGLVPGLAGAHVIPGGGHWIQQEKPAEVNALLLSFLAGLPLTATVRYAAGAPNQVDSASASPAPVPSPTHAT